MVERFVDPEPESDSPEFDNTLRPTSLDEMLGQEKVKA